MWDLPERRKEIRREFEARGSFGVLPSGFPGGLDFSSTIIGLRHGLVIGWEPRISLLRQVNWP